MTKKARLYSSGLSILLMAIIASCTNQQEERTAPKQAGVNQPDQVMTNSEIFLMTNGRRSAVVKSETLKVYSRVDTTLLYNLQVRFFDSTGTQTSTLTSDSGTVSQRNNTMSAAGHVKAWTNDNRRLITDSLRWDAKTDKVMTEGYVEIYKGNDKLTGYGLETDQRLEKVTIKRNLQGSFNARRENK